MSRKLRGCMLGFDAPFNPLRVKGAHGRGRKERQTDLENDSNGPSGDGASLEAMVLPLSPRNISAYSFLSGGKDKETSDPGDDSTRPPTSWSQN
ncbi:hypothetical protein HAX54_052974, partial [Datura stramonium]|nr:hypothetical protein [Datura stramonium]